MKDERLIIVNRSLPLVLAVADESSSSSSSSFIIARIVLLGSTY